MTTAQARGKTNDIERGQRLGTSSSEPSEMGGGWARLRAGREAKGKAKARLIKPSDVEMGAALRGSLTDAGEMRSPHLGGTGGGFSTQGTGYSGPRARFDDGGDPMKFAALERRKILTALGDLSGINLWWDRALLAVWKAPAKTGGGIIRPDSHIDEDVAQGCVALLVKLGPTAYLNDEWARYEHPTDKSLPMAPSVGDWVLFARGYGTRIKLRGVDCVVVERPHDAIKATVSRLDMVDLF